MSWLDKLRQQPYEKKVRLIWLGVVVCTLLLIFVWILAARFQKNSARDTSLFQTIGQGIQNIQNSYHK